MSRPLPEECSFDVRGRRALTVVVIAIAAFMCVGVFPRPAAAQGAITGMVKDDSGGVLPGVTVEVASPELIEKTRTTLTDGQGRYHIADLRPGPYSVTFSLAGFNTVRREGIDVTVTNTATVNAELGVGGVAETLTVTGDAPLVDVQRTSTQTVMSKTLLDAVPNQRAVQRYTMFIPGVVSSGASALASGLGREMGNLAIHGGRIGEANTLIEGIATRHLNGTGGSPRFQINQAMVQEVAVSLGSAGAEQQMGGIMQNIVPRQGGNNFSGLFYFHYTNDSFTGDNLSDELEELGLGSSGAVRESWDINPGFGGPILRDKLWFFAAYRHWGNEIDSGSRYNLTPTSFTYTPDLSRPTASYRFSDRNYHGPRRHLADLIKASSECLLRQQPAYLVPPEPRQPDGVAGGVDVYAVLPELHFTGVLEVAADEPSLPRSDGDVCELEQQHVPERGRGDLQRIGARRSGPL